VSPEARKWLVTWSLQGRPFIVSVPALLTIPEEAFIQARRALDFKAFTPDKRIVYTLYRSVIGRPPKPWCLGCQELPATNEWYETVTLPEAQEELRQDLLRRGYEVPT